MQLSLSVQLGHVILDNDEPEENPKTKTATVFGYDLPTDATEYFGLSSDYLTVFQNARDAWMTEYSGDAQKIPFVLHTD